MSTDSETGLSKAWFWARIIWAIIRNFIYVAFIVLAFDKLQTPFEIIVLSVLILIFQSVNWAATTQLRLAIEEGMVQRHASLAILQKLGEDTADTEAAISGIELKYTRNNPFYYINLVGASLIYAGLVVKLAMTLI